MAAPIDDAIARVRGSLIDDGIAICQDTNLPEWDGQRIDHDLCVAALFCGERLSPEGHV